MILDLERFVSAERGHWRELEKMLDELESDPATRWSLDRLRRFHYLYQRASAGLAKAQTFAAEPELRRHLEELVARAYGEVHEVRRMPRGSFRAFLFGAFPRAFRRHAAAFALAAAATAAGAAFGGLAILLDPDAKPGLIPFPHLAQSPAQRVAQEESATESGLEGHQATFSSELMTHNTRVAIFCLGLGVTWGIGTLVLLFYNGVILGAVAADYVAGGEAVFLLGWLLPHGVVEIPAFLIAAQAGLVLASAMVGWRDRTSLRERLRRAGPDVAVLIGGVATLLVWAGLVESFVSQTHAPVLPYAVKIVFGLVELAALGAWLGRAGRSSA